MSELQDMNKKDRWYVAALWWPIVTAFRVGAFVVRLFKRPHWDRKEGEK